MSDIIRLKRSSVVGSIPTALEFGEIALNYADGVVYYKNAAGVIVALTTGTAVVVPTDADFASVSLLLHGDGNLTDSSSLARTVTAVGTVTSNGAAKFGANSLAFVGSGKLTIPTDASLTFAGDFTVEFWCKFSSLSSTYGAFFAGDTGATQMFLTTQSNGQGLRWGLSWTAEYASGSCTWATGQWYHVAVRRAGTYVTMWVDGVNITSGAPTNATTYSGGLALMGGIASVQDFDGFVDDFRVTKGVARTITVPTAAYPNAGPAVTTPTDADFASVSLLLHMDGTNGSSTFTDSSLYATAGRLTRQGNAQISTAQSQFGSASGLFGGASDWVTTPTDSTLTLGSGDCTLEFFFRSGNTSSRMGVVGNRTGSGGDAVFCVVLNPANLYGFGYILMHTDNSAIISTATSWSANAWHYCAIVRSGSAWSLYLDGTRVGTATSSVDLNATSTLYLGKEGSRNDQSSPMDGNIDELRITQGHARYTGATMTVPTAAYPNA